MLVWLLGALGLTGGGIGVAALLGGGPWMLATLGKPLWQWLCHRSFWQLVAMALLVPIVVQHFELVHERKNAASYRDQRDDYKRQLDAISSKRNEQAVVTREKIKVVTQRIHDADGRARIIERAPLPGQCKTPRQVLDADI